MSGNATLQEEYQDNVLFSPTVKESSWLTTLAPEIHARFGDYHTSATASARLEGRAYATDNDLNTVAQLYAVAVESRRERTSGGVSAILIRDTTLDSELQQTGIVLGRNARVSGVAGAEFGYALSELTQTTWRYRYTDTRYTAPALVDYLDHEIEWETIRTTSEAGQSAGFSLSASFLDADPTYRSQEWDATMSFVHPLSEREQVALAAGARWTRVETGAPSNAVDTDTGLVGEASFIRRWESANLSLTASKRTNPSGSGHLVDTTHVAAHGEYSLTDRVTTLLEADWYWNTEVVALGTNLDSTFFSIEPALSRQLGERFTATAAYTHSRQRLDPAGRVTANRVMVRLVYEWDQRE